VRRRAGAEVEGERILRPVVLHEESGFTDSPLVADTAATARAARGAGWEVHAFASDFDILGTAEEALEHVPVHAPPRPAVWLGFIPSPERYRAVHAAARGRGLLLLNDPDAYVRTTELDAYLPRLAELTFESAIALGVVDAAIAAERIGYPVFVKGAVRSARTSGWRACVAEDEGELREIVRRLLGMEARSRGRVVVRRLGRLRHARTTEHGFPLGREYRVVLHRAAVVGHGYYWEGDDPLAALSPDEEAAVLAVARTAAAPIN